MHELGLLHVIDQFILNLSLAEAEGDATRHVRLLVPFSLADESLHVWGIHILVSKIV